MSNQIADLGAYLKADGSTGTLGEVSGSLGDVNLANNPFYSHFTDTIPLTEAARTLPGLKGAGKVRDLKEAASLDAALVNDVQGLVGTARERAYTQKICRMLELEGLNIIDWHGGKTRERRARNDEWWRDLA